MTYNFTCYYPFDYLKIWKVSLHYLQKWQNYAEFSCGNLAVKTLSKIVSAIHDRTNTISVNPLSREKCSQCLQLPLTYSCQTIARICDSFLSWTCIKLSHIFSSATFDSETVVDFGRRFQKNFMHCCCCPTISPSYSNLVS